MTDDINKKLYFAAHAPSEVPRWYLNKFGNSTVNEVLYFSWRIYYAEQMILELKNQR